MARKKYVTSGIRLNVDVETNDADNGSVTNPAVENDYHWKMGIDIDGDGTPDAGYVEVREGRAAIGWNDGVNHYYIRINSDGTISSNPAITPGAHTHVEADITDLDHYDNVDFTADFAAEDLANLGTRAHVSLTGIGANDHHNQSHSSADHTDTYLQDVVDDTTPQLGGNLDCNTNIITGCTQITDSGNHDRRINPHKVTAQDHETAGANNVYFSGVNLIAGTNSYDSSHWVVATFVMPEDYDSGEDFTYGVYYRYAGGAGADTAKYSVEVYYARDGIAQALASSSTTTHSGLGGALANLLEVTITGTNVQAGDEIQTFLKISDQSETHNLYLDAFYLDVPVNEFN